LRIPWHASVRVRLPARPIYARMRHTNGIHPAVAWLNAFRLCAPFPSHCAHCAHSAHCATCSTHSGGTTLSASDGRSGRRRRLSGRRFTSRSAQKVRRNQGHRCNAQLLSPSIHGSMRPFMQDDDSSKSVSWLPLPDAPPRLHPTPTSQRYAMTRHDTGAPTSKTIHHPFYYDFFHATPPRA
jgi:hypothetical protein